MGSSKPASGGGACGSPQPPAAVCCMCGDHGLLPELFRCAACSVRSQHTYCTDRYPKADSYGMCNWCLRADQASAGAATSSSPRSSGKAAGQSDRPASAAAAGSSVPAKVAAARLDFATARLNSKPIKKQQHQQQRVLLRRSASDVGSRVRPADHGAPAPPSPGVARGRTRIRRYRLLEEVITSM